MGYKDRNAFKGHHEDEAMQREDDFDEDSGFTEAAYKNRPLANKQSLMMAKSLPMNVPMPEQRNMFFNKWNRSPDEEAQDIPTKIAEIAKSLHVDSIGELPSPRLLE